MSVAGLGTHCVSRWPACPWWTVALHGEGQWKGEWEPDNLLFSCFFHLQKKRRAATARRQHLKVRGTAVVVGCVSQPSHLSSQAKQLSALSLLEGAMMHNVGASHPTPHWVSIISLSWKWWCLWELPRLPLHQDSHSSDDSPTLPFLASTLH